MVIRHSVKELLAKNINKILSSAGIAKVTAASLSHSRMAEKTPPHPCTSPPHYWYSILPLLKHFISSTLHALTPLPPSCPPPTPCNCFSMKISFQHSFNPLLPILLQSSPSYTPSILSFLYSFNPLLPILLQSSCLDEWLECWIKSGRGSSADLKLTYFSLIYNYVHIYIIVFKYKILYIYIYIYISWPTQSWCLNASDLSCFFFVSNYVLAFTSWILLYIDFRDT